MDGRDSIQSLLVRRKLTRAIADVARAQMLEYLAVLAPLLRPFVPEPLLGHRPERSRYQSGGRRIDQRLPVGLDDHDDGGDGSKHQPLRCLVRQQLPWCLRVLSVLHELNDLGKRRICSHSRCSLNVSRPALRGAST